MTIKTLRIIHLFVTLAWIFIALGMGIMWRRAVNMSDKWERLCKEAIDVVNPTASLVIVTNHVTYVRTNAP